MRGFQATMTDWARLDFRAALEWAREAFPELPVAALGHSFGGQALGLVPGGRRFRALVTVAAQSGYWGHWPRPRRYGYALLWYVVFPLLVRLRGRFPARALGLGEDLPPEVARQWARWCRSPDYLGDYSGHRTLEAPLLAWSFTDDPFAPEAAVAALHAEYRRCDVTRRHLAPDDVGCERLGHFGFFREERGRPLWEETAGWLEETLGRD